MRAPCPAVRFSSLAVGLHVVALSVWLSVVASGALEASAERVALIRLCRDAGFTLAEIGRLLAAWSRGRRDWTQLAQLKIAELDARIADTQRAKELVEHALECPHHDLLACPNFRCALEVHLDRPRGEHR